MVGVKISVVSTVSGLEEYIKLEVCVVIEDLYVKEVKGVVISVS